MPVTIPDVVAGITPEEWKYTRDMIAECAAEQASDERREDFARRFFQWDLAVRYFRKMEMKRMIHGEPSEMDYRCQALLLHTLAAGGHAFVMLSKTFSPEELSVMGLKHEDIVAYVEELEQSNREAQCVLSPAELEIIQRQVFGAA
jgi:hypothetical protein